MASITATRLDLRGLSRPLPMVRTAIALKKTPPGHLVEAVTTDPGSAAEFPAWCRSTGNELVEAHGEGGDYRVLIRKR